MVERFHPKIFFLVFSAPLNTKRGPSWGFPVVVIRAFPEREHFIRRGISFKKNLSPSKVAFW